MMSITKNPDTIIKRQLNTFFKKRARKLCRLVGAFREFNAALQPQPYAMLQGMAENEDAELVRVERIIRKGVDHNIFKVRDASVTSRALMNTMRSYDLFLFRGMPMDTIEKELGESLRIFLRGIS